MNETIKEGKWEFNGKSWSNECGKCCFNCDKLDACEDYCGKVLVNECTCLGCKHDE